MRPRRARGPRSHWATSGRESSSGRREGIESRDLRIELGQRSAASGDDVDAGVGQRHDVRVWIGRAGVADKKTAFMKEIDRVLEEDPRPALEVERLIGRMKVEQEITVRMERVLGLDMDFIAGAF